MRGIRLLAPAALPANLTERFNVESLAGTG